MFRSLLEEKLEHVGKDYVLIGESHSSASSALYALHSCEDALLKAAKQDKQTIFLTEDLNALTNAATQKDPPYTREDLATADISERDQMLLGKLIDNGIQIYGLENSHTNPFIELEYKKGMDLHKAQQGLIALCEVLATSMPEYKEFISNKLPKLLNFIDEDLDRANYEQLLTAAKGPFNQSDQRIIRLNEVALNKIQSLTQNKSNVLCAVGVGVAHIGKVTDKASNNLLEAGLLERTLEALPPSDRNVAVCYVTNQEDISRQKVYTPIQWNPRVTFGDVEPVLLFKSAPMPSTLFAETNKLKEQPKPPKKDEPPNKCIIS